MPQWRNRVGFRFVKPAGPGWSFLFSKAPQLRDRPRRRWVVQAFQHGIFFRCVQQRKKKSENCGYWGWRGYQAGLQNVWCRTLNKSTEYKRTLKCVPTVRMTLLEQAFI